MRTSRATARLTAILALFCSAIAAGAGQRDYPLMPVSIEHVRINDQFWSRRLEVNRTVTIPYVLDKCAETGRVSNFAVAAGVKTGEQCGVYPFDDSDVYKIIEAASYSMILHPDPLLSARVDSLIALIAGAQENDGYIYTARTNKAKRLLGWAGASRWSKLGSSHELYNAGHLYEAASAHFRSTGKRTLLDVAIKNANLIAATFGPTKRRSPPGHQEIELGLVKLYRITQNEEYLRLAKSFLEERGRSYDGRQLWGEYAQDHKPVLQQNEAVGHAVRFMYMCSAMADIAALTGDERYGLATRRLWDNVVGKKLYLTGGIGAQGFGEGFSGNFELPNLSAYCETCASIANVLFNHRLFLLSGDATYVDVLEQTLYNGVIAAVSMEGNRFFYPNPLASRGFTERSPWFDCACCPPNIARIIPSIPGFIYAIGDSTLYVNLYIANSADVHTAGTGVHLVQETDYPWTGNVKLHVDPDRPMEFALCLRLPGWARNEPLPGGLYRYADRDSSQVTLTVNGQPARIRLDHGYARLIRRWSRGDRVELNMNMPVRRTVADERVEADRGKVALQRGPMVYCAEGADNPRGEVLNMFLPDEAALQTSFQKEILNGIAVVRAQAFATTFAGPGVPPLAVAEELTAIPYYAWAHRGRDQMTVWIPRDAAHTEPGGAPGLAMTASVVTSGGEGADALNDGRKPENSHDRTHGFFRWAPGRDTVWAQYEFGRTVELSEVKVYWLDEGLASDCRVPQSWRILARIEGKWEAVYNPQKVWGTQTDRFNHVAFETARTDALRLEAISTPGKTIGILEWEVN